MKCYGFLMNHGYTIMKGYVYANSEEEAVRLAESEKWYDIFDEAESDILAEGYEVVEIWEIK